MSTTTPGDDLDWWNGGRKGTLSPWTKAKIFGMHTIAKQKGWKLGGHDIQKVVTKVGGGKPTVQAINQLRAIFEEDPDWHPGKCEDSRNKPGPKPKFTEQKKNAVAKAAMAMKQEGWEPTAAGVVARCPKASLNPDTGKAFDEKLIRTVFESKCYDLDPSEPWTRRNPLSKTALPDWLTEWRLKWGRSGEPAKCNGGGKVRAVELRGMSQASPPLSV